MNQGEHISADAGHSAERNRVIYAAVSTDRGRERGYATAIQKNGIVRKAPLFPEGKENARRLYENISDLKQHLIPAAEHTILPDGSLELPFVPWPTLSNYMKGIIREDQEEQRFLDEVKNHRKYRQFYRWAAVDQNQIRENVKHLSTEEEVINGAMRLYTDENSEDVAFFSGYHKHRRLNAEDFREITMLDFENRKFPAPKGYDNYLFMTLGKDYMKYPPEEERKPKHSGIFNPDRPYTDYQRMLTHMLDGAGGKKIILFGTGLMFEDYMEKWGKKYPPEFLADNDKNRWGRKRLGIPVRPPEEILKIPEEKRRLIICSFYYKEIQKQLEQMGIRDYRVYIQRMDWILEAEERGAE